MDNIDVQSRLKALDLVIPPPPPPAATYAPYVVAGNLLIVSGQLPMQDGKPQFIGKVGQSITLEQAVQAARLCAINILAQARAACGGDFASLARCVRLGGFVNCTDDFTQQPQVINGASQLMLDVLGEAGMHARAAVGVNALPLGVCVEVEATFLLK